MRTGQKLIYAIFVTLLVTSFVLSHPIRALADEMARLAASADEIRPIQIGEMAPGFTVRTVDDEPFVFDPENLDAPIILITFRGGWCPYCNMHLSELRTVMPKLKDKGIDVYFLSGDRPELLYSSLKLETQEAIDGLGYTILSDASIDAAMALGIAFKASDATIKSRLDKGQDIDGSSMFNFQALPVPAVYMIDKSGKVVYSFVEADYKVRLPAEDLLEVAEELTD
jgi:peroxiredoxin